VEGVWGNREVVPALKVALAMLIAGNWKMYKTATETAEFCRALREALAGLEDVDVAVCPPFTGLAPAVQALADTEIAVAAQNVHWEPEGAYTGEVSASMLVDLGVYGAIVGHSERRQHFGETDDTVARRAAAALDAGLSVIACVGELEEEREAGETEGVLRRQLGPIEAHDNLVIAYEPVWAIGTGKTATPETAQEAHAFVKSLLEAPVLYGGSVKPENASELLAQPDVDGALVGGASLDVDSFVAICRAAAPTG
jgi:triosephosphate isomerase (TIM)